MKIYIQKTGKNSEIKFSGTVLKLLNQLEINPETVIVTSNDVLVTEEDKLINSDLIEILQVVSGG
jgi:sulfur carrier protein ThiS